MGKLQGDEYYGLGDTYKTVPSTGKKVGFISAALGTLGNAANRLFGDDRNVTAQSNGDVVSGVVDSNIGSRPDSIRLGVPTPSGTAPLVSFGGGKPKTSTTMAPAPLGATVGGDTSWEAPQKAAPTRPVVIKRGAAYVKPTVTGLPAPAAVVAEPTAAPAAATPEPVSAGYGTGELGTFHAGAPMVAAAPAAPIAYAPPTTTYGDSSGVYVLGPGENPPPNLGNMDIGQVVGRNIALKQAGLAANAGTQQKLGAHYATTDAIAAAKAPGEIIKLGADTGSIVANTNKVNALLPGEVRQQGATLGKTAAETTKINELLPGEKKVLDATAEFYRKHGISLEEQNKLGWAKLQTMKDVQTARATLQAKGLGQDVDGTSTLAAIKTLMEHPDASADDVAKAKDSIRAILKNGGFKKTRTIPATADVTDLS